MNTSSGELIIASITIIALDKMRQREQHAFSPLIPSMYPNIFRYGTYILGLLRFWEWFYTGKEKQRKGADKTFVFLLKAVIRLMIYTCYIRLSNSLPPFPPRGCLCHCADVSHPPTLKKTKQKAEAVEGLTDEGICREGSLSCMGTSFQAFGGSPLGIFAVGPGRRLGMIVRAIPSVGILVVFYRYTRNRVLCIRPTLVFIF